MEFFNATFDVGHVPLKFKRFGRAPPTVVAATTQQVGADQEETLVSPVGTTLMLLSRALPRQQEHRGHARFSRWIQRTSDVKQKHLQGLKGAKKATMWPGCRPVLYASLRTTVRFGSFTDS